MKRWRTAAIALLCASLTACGGAPFQRATPSVPQAARAGAAAPLLYLLDGSVPPVAIDEVPVSGGPPIAKIRNGLNAAGGAMIDKSGTLYVINFTGAQYQVLEYPQGAQSPAATITVGIGFPGGMAVGPKGELYVFNLGGPLVMYAPGATTPTYATFNGVCAAQSAASFAAVTVDRFDTLYALSQCRGGPVVREYENGSTHIARTIRMPASTLPIGLTADKKGMLYVVYFDLTQNYRLGLAEYTRRATIPSVAFDFGPFPTFGSGGSGPVVDEVTGRLFTTFGICIQNTGPWHCKGFIYGFRPGSKKPSITIPAPHLRLLGAPSFDGGGKFYTEQITPKSPVDTIWRYSASGTREARIMRRRSLSLISVFPNANSPNIIGYSAVAGAANPACQPAPMSHSKPRSFLANARNAMSVSVLMMPSSAATCSVTKSFNCSCSLTRAMATRSKGPATE